jgi:hypothetical protein
LVIAVMMVTFAVVVGIAREDCGTARQLLISDSDATVLGYFFLDFRAPKKCNETVTKGEFNEMKSRIGRNHSVAATYDQSAAGRREGKAKM